MHILICNDDGIEAPGIKALEELATEFGKPVVVAPRAQQSGVSHQVTVDGPIAFEQVGDHRFSIEGSPADCVRVALTQLDFEFSLVLSGINSGGNLGVDVFMSGTAAAARESSYFGINSFAISQYRSKDYVSDWERSKKLARRGIEFALSREDTGEGFWNINLPSVSNLSETGQEIPVRLCKLDRNPHRIVYRRTDNQLVYDGVYQDRPRDTSSDVDLCFGGAVTLTRCI